MENQRRPLRGVLIGFGNVAVQAHLPLWKGEKDFKIEAVLETDPERRALAKVLLPDAEVLSEFEALEKDRFDFADICTPPCFHRDLALRACRSGMHIFCEKPLVTKWKEFPEIEDASGSLGLVVFTVNNWKYAPLWVKTIELIREGKIGSVRSVSLAVRRPPDSGGGASNWRRSPEISGGGILLDHGWHHLYLMMSMINERPLSISARMNHPAAGEGVEDVVDLMIVFPAAEGRLHLSWRADSRQNSGFIEGDRGTLVVKDDHLVLRSEGFPPARYDFPEALSRGSHHLEWMRPVVNAFRRELIDGEIRGSNLRESGLCALLIHLAYQSDLEGARFIDVRNGEGR